MHARHVPAIDARYWTGIAFASIFGTNMGDFYAHESGLGLLGGVPILVAVFLAVYAVERFDRSVRDAYYWLCIIIMRTGATNIADYLAGRRGLDIDRVSLSIGLGLILAVLAWWAGRSDRSVQKSVPDTDPRYWVAMLVAGVFGTVLGDLCEHAIGKGGSALALGVLLALALLIYRRGVLRPLYAYWLTIGVARTTGTAIGDWFADSKALGIGLPLCTLLTGLVFTAVLVLWRGHRAPGVAANSS